MKLFIYLTKFQVPAIKVFGVIPLYVLEYLFGMTFRDVTLTQRPANYFPQTKFGFYTGSAQSLLSINKTGQNWGDNSHEGIIRIAMIT